MKLWLDDDRDPGIPFIQREFRSEPGMIWVKTVPEAIKLLRNGGVTFISLDHDLGQKQTGYDLASWIEEQAYHRLLAPLEWRIHAQNSGARRAMYMAMMNADRYWAENSRCKISMKEN